jgi:hypothetical protein
LELFDRHFPHVLSDEIDADAPSIGYPAGDLLSYREPPLVDVAESQSELTD